jgi:hypothetical protein
MRAERGRKRRWISSIDSTSIVSENTSSFCRRSRSFAFHQSMVSAPDVMFDPIENTIVALQRAGILDRVQAVRLQARYLRESRARGLIHSGKIWINDARRR